MAVARVSCRAQIGLDAPLVQVEVSLAAGLPTFYIVGLPATVVKESKERVRAALLNSHFEFPAGRITVSLAPAELPKEGGRYDLPIALGVLLASGQVRVAPRRQTGEPTREFYGELGLAGELKPVSGLLIAAAHARVQGHELIVPQANAAETCAVAPGLTRAARNLLEVCAHVSGAARLPLAAAVDGALKRTHGVEVRGRLGGVGGGAHGALGLARPVPLSRCNLHRIFSTYVGNGTPSVRSSSQPPEATACSSSVHPARARACWRNAFPDSCRHSVRRRRSRSRPSRRRVSPVARPEDSASGLSARPTTAPRSSRSWVVVLARSPARSAWRITACCFSMSCRSSPDLSSRRCVSRSRAARSRSRALRSGRTTPRAFSSSPR